MQSVRTMTCLLERHRLGISGSMVCRNSIPRAMSRAKRRAWFWSTTMPANEKWNSFTINYHENKVASRCGIADWHMKKEGAGLGNTVIPRGSWEKTQPHPLPWESCTNFHWEHDRCQYPWVRQRGGCFYLTSPNRHESMCLKFDQAFTAGMK